MRFSAHKFQVARQPINSSLNHPAILNSSKPPDFATSAWRTTARLCKRHTLAQPLFKAGKCWTWTLSASSRRSLALRLKPRYCSALPHPLLYALVVCFFSVILNQKHKHITQHLNHALPKHHRATKLSSECLQLLIVALSKPSHSTSSFPLELYLQYYTGWSQQDTDKPTISAVLHRARKRRQNGDKTRKWRTRCQPPDLQI